MWVHSVGASPQDWTRGGLYAPLQPLKRAPDSTSVSQSPMVRRPLLHALALSLERAMLSYLD